MRGGDGEPEANAIVQLFHDGALVANARTNRNGIFETDIIEQGSYRVVAYKEGYYRNTTTLRVNGMDAATSLTIEQGSVTLTFEVTDDHFSPPRPVEGATIQVEGVGSVQTLGDGENTLSVPVNAAYQLSITKDGYEEVTRQIRVGESARTVSATISRTPGINVELSNGQVVVGQTVQVTVTDEYGTPVSGATVTVNGEQVGQTNAEGQLTVTIDSAGDRTITASVDGLSDSATVQGVNPGGTTVSGTQTTESSSVFGPGFTPVAAILALLLVVGGLLRRRT
ncbi:MAG: PGF-CTERM sorting domain-containing protein [Halorientalis sp.]